MYMTKIALTDGLKQTALQQYHPYVNIELWSLEQNSYDEENNTEDIIIQFKVFKVFKVNKEQQDQKDHKGHKV